ncbi:MAG: DUF6029 family protein [Flavobacterium haoranii]
MKNIYLILAIVTFGISSAQDSLSVKNKLRLSGGFESNNQYYLDDSKLGDFGYENRFRSNTYFNLNFNYGKWTTGFQIESYEPDALLNYNPKFKDVGFGTYYLNFKSDKVDFTLGHYYEQFGSGLLLRTWEDRALGINNALLGGRLIYRPTENVNLKILYGRQRSGFEVTDGHIFGADSEFYLNKLFKFQVSSLSVGFSYVGRYEKIAIENPNFDALTNGFAGRFNFNHNSFYMSGEFNYKSEDAIIDIQNKINNNLVKSGSAVLTNFGYSKNGLGIDVSLRRLENMGFFSEREPEIIDAENTSINYNDKFMNYIPALTKQHHSNLANIYVYQAQSRVSYLDVEKMKAGETGGQIDVFYNFKKGTKLGGKYGTKVAFNYSAWYNLPGEYRYFPEEYKTDVFGVGDKYFTDINFEVKKRMASSWYSNLYYVNQYYDKSLLEGGDLVKTNILSSENIFKFGKSRSLRVEAEHMWADADRYNWAGATVEYNFNQHFSCYFWDIYNYGAHYDLQKNHYFNMGGAYRKGATRIAVNYGRQRGGLVCVGGVCRFVPESTGISLSLSTSF